MKCDFFARTQKRESLQRLHSHDGLLSGDRRFSASGLPDGRESRRFTRASLLQRHARRYVSEIRRDLVFFLNYSCCIKKRAARIWWQINGDVNRHSRPVAPTPRSTCPHFYKWLGTGCIVSGRTTNTKLTKLYWPSRKRSPKRLIVLLEPKSGGTHFCPPLLLWTGASPQFQICSGATARDSRRRARISSKLWATRRQRKDQELNMWVQGKDTKLVLKDLRTRTRTNFPANKNEMIH